MFKSEEKLIVVDKEEKKWEKEGKNGIFYNLYLKDKNGLVECYGVNERIYKIAQKDKAYKLTLVSGYKNKIEINDIGE